jgi:hypothetical protein
VMFWPCIQLLAFAAFRLGYAARRAANSVHCYGRNGIPRCFSSARA